jgi:hypothetical protein
MAFVAALLPMTAPAHIVYGSPSIYQLVVDSDLVVRARIVEPSGELVATEASVRRPVVVAAPLQIYKGPSGQGPIRFAQHGHGVARYEVGDEALLFLRRIERSRELETLATAGDVRWVSLQEHQSAFTLTPEERPAFAAAVGAWAAAAAVDDPSARLDSLREVTVEILRSSEQRLARSALRDLVLMGGVLVTDGTAPALVTITDDPTIDIGVRLGVLTVLEQQNRVAGPNRWADLLRTTPQPDLIAVVRAVSAHPSPQVTAELMKLLEEGDPATAAAAAVSLGVPGNDAAVAPLRRALKSGDERLQMAAIRGLGRIGTPHAMSALHESAQDHPDDSVRRRSAGEVARLEGR